MASASAEMSEAERERAANIKRNEEFMRSVGIIDAVAEAQKVREEARRSRAPRAKPERNPEPARLSSRNAGREKKTYMNDLPPQQLEAVNPKSRARKAEQIIGGQEGEIKGRITSGEGPKRRRHPPAPYPQLFARLPTTRPLAAETVCSLFSDRELRVLVKHNGLREGDHSKIAKSKAVAAYYNTGATGLIEGADAPAPAAAAAAAAAPAAKRRPARAKPKAKAKSKARMPKKQPAPTKWVAQETAQDAGATEQEAEQEAAQVEEEEQRAAQAQAQVEEEDDEDEPAAAVAVVVAAAASASSSLERLSGGATGGRASLSGGLSGGGGSSGSLSGGSLSGGSLSGGGHGRAANEKLAQEETWT
jgi:hypothetical protein